jgi:hypothetical protein
MFAAKTFGKLGKRSMARLPTAIDGGLVLPERSVSCRMENVSRNGCRLHLAAPPRLGATILLRIERIETLATVVWVRSGRCGVAFERPLDPRALERLRWIAEHETAHINNRLGSAAEVWR